MQDVKYILSDYLSFKKPITLFCFYMTSERLNRRCLFLKTFIILLWTNRTHLIWMFSLLRVVTYRPVWIPSNWSSGKYVMIVFSADTKCYHFHGITRIIFWDTIELIREFNVVFHSENNYMAYLEIHISFVLYQCTQSWVLQILSNWGVRAVFLEIWS